MNHGAFGGTGVDNFEHEIFRHGMDGDRLSVEKIVDEPAADSDTIVHELKLGFVVGELGEGATGRNYDVDAAF